MEQQKEPKRLVYFMPNQLVFQFNHRPDYPPKLDTLQQYWQQYLKESGLGDKSKFWSTFKASDGFLSAFRISKERSATTLFATVEGTKNHDDDDKSLIQALYDVFETQKQRAFPVQKENGDLQLTSVAPNWLSGAAQGGSTWGGPGARPVAENDPGVKWQFDLTPIETLMEKSAQGENVNVFILDTAPSTEALEVRGNNPLLTRMLAPGGIVPSETLSIDYAPDALMTELVGNTFSGHGAGKHYKQNPKNPQSARDEYDVREHDYRMSDHGLFVAGIINSLAPKAKLHIIQVLSDFGAGNFRLFHWAITQCLPSILKDGQPAVVNLSLVFSTPFTGPVPKNGDDKDETGNALRGTAMLPFIEFLTRPIQDLCRAIETLNAQAIAAAGNDGLRQSTRPDTRYPAAFDGIEGIGALKDNAQVAGYSNLSDMGRDIGVIAFGGDVDSQGVKASASAGIVGVFTAQTFPDGSNNNTGWARWAGTSFATPVVAGLVAALCDNRTTPQAALSALKTALNSRAGSTEKLLPIVQQ